MLRLRTFGGLSIERIDGPEPPAAVAGARRRLALLAALAAAGDRGVRRDKLLALFWPESDGERARHALVQALFALKRDLGVDTLVTGRDELQLNPAAIASDIGEFRAALAAGDRTLAAGLYTGPFLDGVYLTGAGEFDRWADEERTRLAREAESALETLATEASARGDHRAAAGWWQRLAEMDPRRTRVVVALMTELAADGDRVGALRHAAIYRTLVKDDLDAEPNPAVDALADRLRKEPSVAAAREAPSPYTPPAQRQGAAPAAPEPSPAHSAEGNGRAVGEMFAGKYYLERELGRGGTATVYLARDPQNSRLVAVKVLRPELAAGLAVERFRKEITVTANLQHPHILPVLESGEANGTLYFVMPYVEGESLRQLLDRERRLSVSTTLRLASEVADALMYAHRRGIVHRDVKPENILITSGHAVVADFGLARALGTASGVRSTLPGAVVGSPAYLSPEQASGEREIDARSDQYSLAYVMYEALAGEAPFRGPSARDLMAQRLASSPSSLRGRRSDVPQSVDDAILRALSRRPADRFPDIESFARALAIPDVATAPPRSLSIGWLGRPTRTKRTIVVAAGVVVLAALATWLRFGSAGSARSGTSRAWVVPAAFENGTGDPVFDGSLEAALSAGLEQSAFVSVFPRTRVRETLARMGRPAASRLDEALAREVAQREGLGAVVSATINRVDSAYMITARVVDPGSGVAVASVSRSSRGRAGVIEALDGVVRDLRTQLGESRSLLAKHDLPLPQATTSSLEGLRKYSQGWDTWNAGQRQQAMELWSGAIALDSDFALAHAALGGAYYWINDRPRGEEQFTKALAKLDRLTDRERFQVRGQIEGWRGNREAAINILRARLAVYPDDRGAWGSIGYNYLRLQRYRESLEAYAKQLAIDSTSPADLINVATSHSGLEHYEESLRYYRRAFQLLPSLRTLENINHEFGETLVLAGHVEEARGTFSDMLSGSAGQQALGHRSLALLDEYEGHYANAIDHFRRAAVLNQSGNHALSEARDRAFLVMALREKGQRDSAKAELKQIYTIFRSSYLEPVFLWYAGKAMVANHEIAYAKEMLDTLTHRVNQNNPADVKAQQALSGEIALAEGQLPKATSILQIVAAADSSALVRETVARAFVATGDLPSAARQYEALVAARKKWFGGEAEAYTLDAMRDLGAVYERLGNQAAARRSYERLTTLWAAADTDLVALRDVRARLAAMGSPGR